MRSCALLKFGATMSTPADGYVHPTARIGGQAHPDLASDEPMTAAELEHHAQACEKSARSLKAMLQNELEFRPAADLAEVTSLYQRELDQQLAQARWYRAQAARPRTRSQPKSRTWTRFTVWQAGPADRVNVTRPHAGRSAPRPRDRRERHSARATRAGPGGSDPDLSGSDGPGPGSGLAGPSPRFSRPWRPAVDARLAEAIARLEGLSP
jgi:hypothetical protein